MDTSNGIEFVIVPLIIAAAFVALLGVILARVTGGVMRWNHVASRSRAASAF